MARMYSFRFRDDALNRKLIALLKSSQVPHQLDPDGTVRYAAANEEVIEDTVIRPLREQVFPRWQVLTCPPNWSARYRQYMEHNGLPFREELVDGRVSFLMPRDLDPHRWKLEAITGLRTK